MPVFKKSEVEDVCFVQLSLVYVLFQSLNLYLLKAGIYLYRANSLYVWLRAFSLTLNPDFATLGKFNKNPHLSYGQWLLPREKSQF